MRTRVITTMSQEYWNKVGQYSVSTWSEFLPAAWEIWTHDTPNIPVRVDKTITQTQKYHWINQAQAYAENRPQPPGYQREWQMFCHKSFAMWESYQQDPQGTMIWCDSDVKCRRHVDPAIVNQALGNAFCAYLGRDRVDTSQTAKKKYTRLTPETCIIFFNLDHPIASKFFSRYEQVYKSMELFDLYSWCDAAVFEYVMQQFPQEYFNDITLNNPPAIAPLPLTFLDEYFEHWMGWTNKEAREDISGQKEKSKIQKRIKKQ